MKSGGLLLAGCDPTGYGGILPGFGDQRGLELLVEAGFTPVEAIHIATQNGATYLGQQEYIGSIAAGHEADLVVDQQHDAVLRRRSGEATGFCGGDGGDTVRVLGCSTWNIKRQMSYIYSNVGHIPILGLRDSDIAGLY